jgi:hypothetical protein
MGDNTRPLAFWGFISSNLFSAEATPDFYLSMAALFEPFIMEKDGQLLDVGALQEYAASKLMLSLSEDITEILASQMSDIGWLIEIARKGDKPLYKCKFTGTKINSDEYDQYDVRLTQLIEGFSAYIKDNSVVLKSDEAAYIEENFTSFLIKQSISSSKDLIKLPINDDSQIEYWIAKYISHINLKDSSVLILSNKYPGLFCWRMLLLKLGARRKIRSNYPSCFCFWVVR